MGMFDAREEAVVANFNIALGGLKHGYDCKQYV